ncbi:MAG TPA: erythromycin esterase family protein [Gemmatimonadales bacterium]|nr:erythromycin esterase family protein [Gemmatimonadales bacterium]
MPRIAVPAAESIAQLASPIQGTRTDYDPLLRQIGEARLVLLGESSHGTHEFYHQRIRITKRLIEELGFNAVAIEGDWPDAYRVNRYVRGQGQDADAEQALAGFRRFPGWMWRNHEVRDFVTWLKARNEAVRGEQTAAGFYGLDLYSLHASIEAVLDYLDRVDPPAAARARNRYRCFESFGADPQDYGYLAGLELSQSCEDEVVRQLLDLQGRRDQLIQQDGLVARDDYFYAEQNARVVQRAERYYRTMFRGQVSSWNLRDNHMANTLDALRDHLEREAGEARIVVWAHNSHVGDARATELGGAGELNLGQLARVRHDEEAVLIGMSTYAGTVTAAREWGAAPEQRRVRPAVPGSYEELLHEVGVPRMLIDLRDEQAAEVLHPERLQRAIGVIYRPETERQSHYFFAHLADQFDSLIYWDTTRALVPLERTASWERGEVYETFPTGI